MKDDKKEIHRGEALRNIVQRSGLPKTYIAKKAGYNRSSLYNHMGTPDLAFSILEKYGKAMEYDFTQMFPEMVTYIAFTDPKEKYPEAMTFEILLRKHDQWRDKYYDLLEKYNKLIESSMNLGGK